MLFLVSCKEEGTVLLDIVAFDFLRLYGWLKMGQYGRESSSGTEDTFVYYYRSMIQRGSCNLCRAIVIGFCFVSPTEEIDGRSLSRAELNMMDRIRESNE
jgi:hypothetical protein